MPFCFIIFLSYLLLGRQPEQGELSVDIPGHSSHEPDKYSTYFSYYSLIAQNIIG